MGEEAQRRLALEAGELRLNNAIPWGGDPDGSRFGAAFARALSVATGNESFAGLPPGAIFLSTRDASDAGSHAFATDVARLLGAWGDRLNAGEMRTGYDWAHLIDEGYGGPLAGDVRRVRRRGHRPALAGSGSVAAAREMVQAKAAATGTGQLKVGIAASQDDHETAGGAVSDELGAGSVGLRFTGLDLAPDAEIASAYFLFQAEGSGPGGGSLRIELEDDLAAAGYAGRGLEDRDYLGSVAWDEVGGWQAGESYRSPDLAALIERLIGDGGLAAKDALAFRISGSGLHSAFSFDSAGAAPQLVISYEV